MGAPPTLEPLAAVGQLQYVDSFGPGEGLLAAGGQSAVGFTKPLPLPQAARRERRARWDFAKELAVDSQLAGQWGWRRRPGRSSGKHRAALLGGMLYGLGGARHTLSCGLGMSLCL